MKPFLWNEAKNQTLIKNRDISFEDIITALDNNGYLDTINNKNYPHQKILVVAINGYAYLVPFVEDKEKVFLKTIIPSRKATKKYLK